MIEGLKQLHRGSAIWGSYLRSEWLPVTSAGYLPPVSKGLQYFLQVPKISGLVEGFLDQEIAEGETDPLDSHPALRDRIAALRGVPPTVVAQDNSPSSNLFQDLQEAETLMAAFALGKPLQAVGWDDVLQTVWVPLWRERVEAQKKALYGVTTANLANELRSGAIRQKLKNPPGMLPTISERGQMACEVAGFAMALILLREGWTFHALPGELYCEKDGERLQPLELVKTLSKGELSPEKWDELCMRYSLTNIPLIEEAATAAGV